MFISQLDIEEVMHNVGRAKLTFSCKPYLYRKDGVYAEKYTQPDFTLTNPEPYPSIPDVTVYASGSITLSINSRSYTVRDVNTQVTLNGELMHAYAGSQLCSDKLDFIEFPTLKSGDNQISWIGNVRSVYITPNWRTL